MTQQMLIRDSVARLPYSRHAWLVTLAFVLVSGVPMHLGWVPAFPLTAQAVVTVIVATLGDRQSGLISGCIASTLVISAAIAGLGAVGSFAEPLYVTVSFIWTVAISYYLGWLRESLQNAVQTLEERGSLLSIRNDQLTGSADLNTRELEQVKDRLIASQARLRSVTRRWVEMQEEERRSLARELHNDIGQSLTALRISLESNKDKFSVTPEATRLIESAYGLVDDVISSVREMSLNLRPSLLDDLGLVPALREHIMKQTAKADMQCNFTVDGGDHFINPTHSIAAYRISQEIISQIIHRGQTHRISVHISIQPDHLVLAITSNETAPEDLEVSRRICSVIERVALVGGEFRINSTDAQRARFLVTIPLHDTSEVTDAA